MDFETNTIMSLHIGLMILKQMKTEGISVSWLAGKLDISKNKAQEIINSSTLDVVLLAEISERLGYNFFSYYEKGNFFSDYSQQELQKSAEEIARLKSILAEKSKALELKDKMIQNLSQTVSLLEKVQYR